MAPSVKRQLRWVSATALFTLLSLIAACSSERTPAPADDSDVTSSAAVPESAVPESSGVAAAEVIDEASESSPPEITKPEMEKPGMETAKRSHRTFSASPSVRSLELESPRAMSSEAMSSEAMSSEATPQSGPFTGLPAGADHEAERGYATVAVFYATDRARGPLPLSGYEVSGNRDAVVLCCGSALVFALLAVWNGFRKRRSAALGLGTFGAVAAAGGILVVVSGTANIEKHGVTYSAERGQLVRGICQVTVPETHTRGIVERPSLLRFEVREDQRKHIVLTEAIELSSSDFQQRLKQTVAMSPDQDLLVFIHGYNVDFQSAVQRTAQIAVDLPFEGVPVCYSWPSQGTLFGYTVDETNAAWTQTHLKQFLLELADESGAKSINVVAHSMGNRPTTGAIAQIARERPAADPQDPSDRVFDRLVMAAPDVDADRFRRDLAPELTKTARHVTLYASSDDQALIASKQVHGYPRAGEGGEFVVVVPGVETIDVSGIDLSLLGHSYYGDSHTMLRDLYQLVRRRLPATKRQFLRAISYGELVYWQLMHSSDSSPRNATTGEPANRG